MADKLGRYRRSYHVCISLPAEVPSQWYCHGEHAYASCRLRVVSDLSDITGGFKERLIDAA